MQIIHYGIARLIHFLLPAIAQALIDAGFKNIYRLEGNYAAWVDSGYPVEK